MKTEPRGRTSEEEEGRGDGCGVWKGEDGRRGQKASRRRRYADVSDTLGRAQQQPLARAPPPSLASAPRGAPPARSPGLPHRPAGTTHAVSWKATVGQMWTGTP